MPNPLKSRRLRLVISTVIWLAAFLLSLFERHSTVQELVDHLPASLAPRAFSITMAAMFVWTVAELCLSHRKAEGELKELLAEVEHDRDHLRGTVKALGGPKDQAASMNPLADELKARCKSMAEIEASLDTDAPLGELEDSQRLIVRLLNESPAEWPTRPRWWDEQDLGEFQRWVGLVFAMRHRYPARISDGNNLYDVTTGTTREMSRPNFTIARRQSIECVESIIREVESPDQARPGTEAEAKLPSAALGFSDFSIAVARADRIRRLSG